MTAGAAAADPIASGEPDVSRTRLLILRIGFLIFVVPGFFVHPQWLIDPDLTRRGMLDCMLLGLWLMSFLGLRYPLQMLPILLFEYAWKLVWLIEFGLPKWLAGVRTSQLQEDMVLIGCFPILFGLIIPWGHVWRRYVRKPAERWH